MDHIPDDSDDVDPFVQKRNQRLAGITGQKALIEEMKLGGPQEDPMQDFGHRKIAEREDRYHQRRMNRALSPERVDAFKPDKAAVKGALVPQKRTYYDIITEQNLENERAEVLRRVAQREEEEKRDQAERLKRPRLNDDTTSTGSVTLKRHAQPSDWDKHEAGPVKQQVKESARVSTKWDTPRRTPAMEGATPRRNRWDLTPS